MEFITQNIQPKLDENIITGATLENLSGLSVGGGSIFEASNNGVLIGGLKSGSLIDIQGWTSSLVFSASDHDTVAWAEGSIILSDGTTYSISAGNTGNMTALTYVYLDLATSSTALQTTTTASNSVGANKILVAVAQNVASGKKAEFQAFGGGGGIGKLITADNITAGTITGNEIAANTIAASKLTVSQLSAISADLGTITAGTITGSTIRTKTSGNRVQLSNDDYIYFLTDSTVKGKIYCDSTYDLILYGADDVVMHAGGAAKAQFGSSSFRPISDGSYDLGQSDAQWRDFYLNGKIDMGSFSFDESGTDLIFSYSGVEKFRISSGGKIRPSDTYEASDGTDGFTGASAYGFLTALRISGESGRVDMDGKYREITVIDGLVTNVSSESDWVFLDSASGI